MYLTDPTLYGVNLPQRDYPAAAPFAFPFVGSNMPAPMIPWQGYQRLTPQFATPLSPYGIQPPVNPQYLTSALSPQFSSLGVNPFAPQGFNVQPQQHLTPTMSPACGVNPCLQQGIGVPPQQYLTPPINPTYGVSPYVHQGIGVPQQQYWTPPMGPSFGAKPFAHQGVAVPPQILEAFMQNAYPQWTSHAWQRPFLY